MVPGVGPWETYSPRPLTLCGEHHPLKMPGGEMLSIALQSSRVAVIRPILRMGKLKPKHGAGASGGGGPRGQASQTQGPSLLLPTLPRVDLNSPRLGFSQS